MGLVVVRKLGEVVRIGDGIEIRVDSLSFKRVQLSITAPEDLRIERTDSKSAKSVAMSRTPDVGRDRT